MHTTCHLIQTILTLYHACLYFLRRTNSNHDRESGSLIIFYHARKVFFRYDKSWSIRCLTQHGEIITHCNCLSFIKTTLHFYTSTKVFNPHLKNKKSMNLNLSWKYYRPDRELLEQWQGQRLFHYIFFLRLPHLKRF